MTDGGLEENDHAREFLQGEYTALRGELIKRVEFRQRLLEITLISAAAILTINLTGREFTRVLLAYPILVMFLAFAWLHHGLRMSVLASYIKDEIEPKFPWRRNGEVTATGYETWLDGNRRPVEQRLGTMASKLMFVSIQILVLGIGVVGATTETSYEPIDQVLVIVDVLVVLGTTGLLVLYQR